MKKTDIAMIILIASVSVFMSYIIIKSLPFFEAANKPQTVPVAKKVDSSVAEVDSTVLNDQAINPTVEVVIGSKNP